MTTGEVWIPWRETFLFRYVVPARSESWTFLVSKQVLDDFAECKGVDPAETFHQFRTGIYAAANERLAWADAEMQQDLSADEIRAAATAEP